MGKEITVDDILKALNLAFYENKDEDKLSIRTKYLKMLKDEIENLREKNKELKEDVLYYKGEVRRLTGKLLEKENQQCGKDFDMYF